MSGWLSEKFSELLGALGTTFRVTRGFRKAGTSPLKRVNGRIFTISKLFHRACRNFILDFLHKKTAKKCFDL
jgi:hypothetical protein